MKLNEQNIKRMILIMPILGIFLTSLTLTNLFINEIKTQYKTEIEQLYIEEEINLRTVIKNRIENSLKLLDKNYTQKFESEKTEVKNTVDIAYKIIEDIYNEYKLFDRSIIISKIKERLRHLRFYDNMSGYYFIFDYSGTSVLLPHMRNLEGTNFNTLENKDARIVIKSFMSFISLKDEGFIPWKWYKPNEDVVKDKIGYLKKFKPLNIFIGSAKYLEDVESSIQKELQDLLNIISFDKKGYIFAYDKDGNTISHIKKNLIGENRWNLNVNGRMIVQEIVNKSLINEDGVYLKYLATIDPKTGKPGEKTSFIKSFEKFEWAIGTGMYNTALAKNIQKKEQRMKEELDNTIYQVAILSGLITAVLSLVMFIIANKVGDIFNRYKLHLKRVNESLELKVKYRTKELEESKERLKEMALRDSLTSLYNRRYFEYVMEKYMPLSIRKDEPLSLIMLDIDKFKTINDTYGHAIGDRVLKVLSDCLINNIRKSDIVARVGGEEFVIVFPNTNIETASTLAEKLRINVEKMSLKAQQYEITFTISIGVATFESTKDETLDSFMKKADDALYRAKNNGRNRVEITK